MRSPENPLEALRLLSLTLLILHSLMRVSFGQNDGVSAEDRKKVGSLILENGAVAGTCFYVDPRGYVATSFTNVQNISESYVVFNDGGRFRVNGFVAASKGKDIAILALGELPKGARLWKVALPLMPGTDLAIGDEVITWSGPGAKLAMPSPFMPSIGRRILGEEYIQGLRKIPLKPAGYDPGTIWYWLNQGRDLSCNGGPVFNRDGDQVIGMLSAGLEPNKPVYAAIHIQHVSRLLPRNDPKPHSLKELRDWVDPSPVLPSTESTEPSLNADENQISLGGILHYGQPLAQRFRSLQDRVAATEKEKAEVDRFQANSQSNNLELLAAIDKIQTALTAIQPEEAYQVEERSTRTQTVTRTERERGSDGKERNVKVKDTEEVPSTTTVTRFRFSRRQLLAIQPLRDRLRTLQLDVQKNKDRFAFLTEIVEPHLKQLRKYQEEEFFYLADPLGLRPRVEQEAFDKSLTETIDEGGAPGMFYIARAMARCMLNNLDGASQDLVEANEYDAKFRSLVRMLETRIAFLNGDKAKGTSLLRGLLEETKTDPRLRVLAARIDIESENFASAGRHLQEASKLAPLAIEIRHGLAWLHLSAPNPNPKTSMDAAMLAVQLTDGRDWSTVSALAASQALAKKVELAEKAIQSALHSAPETAKETCEEYQRQLVNTKSIKRIWK